jgi:hypothetical protein
MIMAIDRRTMLRGMGRVAAAGGFGAALAAAASVRPSGPTAPGVPAAPVARPRTLAGAAARWAAIRPSVVPRAAWRTDKGNVSAHARPHPCAPAVTAVFIHHTDTGNRYTRRDVPRMIQSFYDDHIEDNDWDDIGYNFLVDRMGNVYEGRAGGIDNAVIGAHTVGFNIGTVGIAAIGSFGAGQDVPEPMLASIARLAAWKLGRYGVDARGRAVLTSSSDRARYRKGEHAVFHAVSGHRDGYTTTCPGDALYGLLPAVRDRAFALQRGVGPLRGTGAPVPPVTPLRTLRTPV